MRNSIVNGFAVLPASGTATHNRTPRAISQHLAKLRLAGVVHARREGQRVFYELVDEGIRDLVTSLLHAPATSRRSRQAGVRA